MEGRRFALLIANSSYNDPALSKLIAPADDATDLSRVLENPDICGFQVQVCRDQPSYKIRIEIEKFFDDRQHDDLLLLYFSGHGIKALDGKLYFAAPDTELNRHQVRRTTAVSAEEVNVFMGGSRSRRQVLLLDCCHSGAFKEGMLAKGAGEAGAEQLQGQGRVVLTASNALQYSFEGDTVHGSGKRSIFTRALVDGLETGEADLDGDGLFDIDDIYSYVRDRLKSGENPQQPTMMGFLEGDIFLGNNPRPRATQLPADLLEDLSHPRLEIRLSAVSRLDSFLQGSHKGRSLAAYRELMRLQEEDDSLQVRRTAKQSVDQYGAEVKAEQQLERKKAEAPEREERAREDADAERQPERQARVAAVEQEQIALEKAEQERQAHEKAESAERAQLARRLRETAREKVAAAEREKAAVAEREWLERAAAERQARERDEQERLARATVSSVEKEQIAHEDAEVEVHAHEKVETEHARPGWEKAAVKLAALSNLWKVLVTIVLFLVLGALFVRLRSPNDVVTTYREAIKSDPNSPDLHNKLGILLQSKGDIDGAIAEYREALRLNPDFSQASANLAPLLQKQEQALEQSHYH